MYFRSGDQRTLTKEGVAKLRLAYAFPAGIQCVQVNSNSPSKSQGLVFADPARHEGKRVGYFPDQQTWRKLPTVEGRPELWVGYWNDAKPGPGDLRRRELLRGPQLKLTDGQAWQIPIVRHFDDASQQWESDLPALLDIDDAGKLIKGTPLKEYSHLWDVTTPLADTQFANDSEISSREVTEEQVVTAVVALLQANYVVALPELIAIGALQEADLAMIALASCRYEALIGWLNTIQKKSSVPSTPSGVITSAGEAA